MPSLSRMLVSLRFGARLAALLVAAQAAVAQQLPSRAFTTADGLAHDAVNCIVRDSRGFLWFCTDDGLSRFDGREFTSYGVAEGLSFPRVNDLLLARDGSYWLTTTGGGVLRFEPAGSLPGVAEARFLPYPGVPRGFTDELHQDGEGQIWVTSLSGLYRLDRERGEFRHVELPFLGNGPPEDMSIGPLVLGSDDSLWLGTSYGLVRRLADGRVFHYPLLGRVDEHVSVLLADPEGRIWTGNAGGLFVLAPEPAESLRHQQVAPSPRHCRVEIDSPARPRVYLPEVPGQLCHYTTEDGLSQNDVRALLRTDGGETWIGTRSGGIVSFDGRSFSTYTDRHGAASRIRALAEDQAGNLWLGTRSRGATRIARGGLLSYGTADGLGSPEVVTIFETESGELVVLTEKWTLNRFDGERFHAVRPNLPRPLIESSRGRWWVLQDRVGEWWVATADGLYRFPRVERLEDLAEVSPRAVYDHTNGLAHDNVNRLFEDSRGDLWISSYLSPVTLVRWQRATQTFHHYGEADGLPGDNWANVFAEDAAGQLWIGLHNGGLARRRNDRFELFGPQDGVPPGMIQGLYRDRAGRVWVASALTGAGWVDEPASARPRIGAGPPGRLTSNNLWCFAEDDEDHLYVGTVSGLDRLHLATGGRRRYTIADGLAASEVRVAFRDRRGSLWLGTREGVSQLVTGSRGIATPPRVWIHRLRVAGVEHPLHELGVRAVEALVLAPHQRRLEVGFFSLDFEPGGGLRYQYRVIGEDMRWSEPTRQRTLAATLAPGRYRLEVRALRGDGSSSSKPATLAVRVLPPLWRRWWFLAAMALAAGWALFLLYRLRVARLLELERVRTRIASDLHDDIGASLSRIAIWSEVIKQRTAAEQEESHRLLGEIADSARGLVDSMSDIVWSIDPRKDSFGDLVVRVRSLASEVLEPAGIRWRLDTPSELAPIVLEPEQRRHLYLIFKEAVHNILRHSGAGEAKLSLALAGRSLRLEVRDDGRGFDPGEQPVPRRGGHGLLNFQTRAAELGGSAEVSSAPGQGTRLVVHVPLRRRKGA